MAATLDDGVLLFSGPAEILPTDAVATLVSARVLLIDESRKRPCPEDGDGGMARAMLNVGRAVQLCSCPDDEPPPRRQVARALLSVFTKIFSRDGATTPDAEGGRVVDAEDVYQRLADYVATRPKRPGAPFTPPAALRPDLRPYQRDAVEWMLAREGLAAALPPPTAEMLWRRVCCADGATWLEWNECNGAIRAVNDDVSADVEQPRPSAGSPSAPPLLGGVLADEMGLGKSVEVLALLLAHPRPAPPPLAAPAQGGGSGEGEGEHRRYCTQGHRLSTHQLDGTDGTLTCDQCGGSVARGGASFLSCPTCDFDVCLPCARSPPPPAEPRDDLPCVCEGTPADFDGQWVGCDGCGRWVHASCAGFATAVEVEETTSYLCLLCASKAGERRPTPSKTTLLICPAAIVGQWRHEAARHVDSSALRVCTYMGVRDATHQGWKQPARLAALHPSRLASFDLVLTTFEVLRSELDHAPTVPGGAEGVAGEPSLGSSRTLRQPHRRAESTAHLVSPLLSLEWWRVVIDEAQMVESGTAKAAAMALRLHAVNRWAVSGTPMGRNRLADLHGLMAFLQLPPWNMTSWWSHAIEMPLTAHAAEGVAAESARTRAERAYASRRAEERLLSLLHAVMWRNSKAMVIAQLDLPPQSEMTHALTFSSIERHFYDKQARECAASAQRALSLRRQQQEQDGAAVSAFRAGQTAAAAERALETLSMQGVLRLRQACCHPQLGSQGLKGGRKAGGAGGGPSGLANPMSMRTILGKLIEELQSTCEEDQRKILFNLSALGSMHSMLGRYAEAAGAYASGLVACAANRSPMALEASIEATLAGPASLGFAAPVGPQQPARPLGPIRWTLGRPSFPRAVAVPRASSPAGLSGSGHVTTEMASETWLRIELSKPLRLSEIRIRCRSGEHATPRTCILHATSGAEHAGVYVEVGSFSVPRPSPPPLGVPTGCDGGSADGLEGQQQGTEWAAFRFYRPFKSKQYRLTVTSWHPPVPSAPSEAAARSTAQSPASPAAAPSAAPGREGGGVDSDHGEAGWAGKREVVDVAGAAHEQEVMACELSEIALFVAEIEVDALQRLHMMHNRAANIALLTSERDGGGGGGGCIGGGGTGGGTGDGTGSSPEGVKAGGADDGCVIIGASDSTEAGKEGSAARVIAGEAGDVPQPAVPTEAKTVAELQAEAESLQSQMVSERSAVATAARMRLANCREAADSLILQLSVGDGSHWLHRLGAELMRFPPHLTEGLRDRLLSEASLSVASGGGQLASACAASVASAVVQAASERDRCMRARESCLEGLDQIRPKPTQADVCESGDCHNCRQDWGKQGALCAHCKREARYDAYFYCLYSHRRQRRVAITDARAAGQEAGAAAGNTGEAFKEEAPLLRLLTVLVGWLSTQATQPGGSSGAWAAWASEGRRELELLGALKREIVACRALWVAHFDLLSQLDELGTAVSTMELVESEEALALINPLEAERHKYVVRYEHAERTAKYEGDLAVAQADLVANKRQYGYLRQQASLADANGDAVVDTCPVCLSEMGRERSVPKCAHSLCMPCTEKIMRRHGGKFVCPVCREDDAAPSMASELRWADGSSAGTSICGSWGTKVTAIIEQVLALPPSDKCLIFSQWDDMLALIGRALLENSVRFERLHGQSKFDAALHGFRHDPLVRALLLPLKSGANGISLVEAQHVLLAEPLLETQVEAQAIGRVHRMSQTRPTVVHRFVIRGTIEEAILGMRRSSSEEGDEEASASGGGGGRGCHDAEVATSPDARKGSPSKGAGSPNKRARRAEESKLLTWETVQALVSSGGLAAPAATPQGDGGGSCT